MADDAVGADELAANAVVDASIASNAAIAFSKMENLTASRLLVSDGNGDVSVSSVTTTNLTDLTDAGETALHTHAGGGSAISRVGGNTTEATTTSTTVVDMITVSGISITGPTPIWNIWKIRKTTGAADNTISGIKLHGTNLNTRISSTTTNRAENSLAHVLFGPRISSYNGGEHYFISDAEEGTFSPLSGDGDPGGATTSTVTSIATVGETDHSSITLGHDELHIYSYTTS